MTQVLDSTSASLRVDGPRKTIRIVNPTDFKLKFTLDPNLETHGVTYDIKPRAGLLPPRSCTLVTVGVVDGATLSKLNGSVNLAYWSGAKGRRFKGSVVIKIDKAENMEVDIASTHLLLRLMKSLFLAGLIFYNIILIKTILSVS